MTPIQQDALSIIFQSRIAELVKFRSWHRTRSAILRPYFADMAERDRIELRALLKLRRMARQIAYAAQVEQDRAVDRRIERQYDERGIELEPFEREGQPEFNGAFR